MNSLHLVHHIKCLLAALADRTRYMYPYPRERAVHNYCQRRGHFSLLLSGSLRQCVGSLLSTWRTEAEGVEEGVKVIGDGEEGGEEEAAVTAATGPSAAAESARTTSYLESASETDARTLTRTEKGLTFFFVQN